MKNIGIEKPCSENWNKMTPTEKGAFCQKCAKQVHDFSNQSLNEIKLTLLESKGESLCVRMTTRQEHELNSEFKTWLSQQRRNPQQLFITALLIVFGLTLFSCEDERIQEQIESVQQIAHTIAKQEVSNLQPSLAPEKPVAPSPAEMIAVEDYIMGAMPVEFVQEPEPIEEVEIVEPEYYILGGASSVTAVYRDYLEQTSTPVELDENGIPYPTEFKALAFPNPAIESTTLEIQAPEKERMDIRLYDSSGKFIREIHSGKISRGTFRQVIDLNDLTSGLYLVIIQSNEFKETVRIVKN